MAEAAIRLVGDSAGFNAAIDSGLAALKRMEGAARAIGPRLQEMASAGAAYAAQQGAAGRAAQAFAASLDRQVAALQVQTAAFGKGAAEALRIKAAQLGIAQASEATIAAIERLTAQQQAQAAAAQRAAAGQQALAAIREAAQQAEARQAQTKAAFIAALQREAEAAGKTRAELLAMRAAQMGLAQEAGPLIARITAADRGMAGLARSGRLSAAELQQVGYQLHDFAVQIASGGSPLVALVQQGSQLSGAFGGVRGALRAVAAAISPAAAGFGLLAASIASAGVAAAQGYEESKRFRNLLIETNNAAGLTTSSLDALAHSSAAYADATIGAAREAALLVAGSGLAAEAQGSAQRATLLLQKVSGAAAADIVKDFARMGDGVARYAVEANKRYNFLTLDTYRYIRALEEQGRIGEAQHVVLDALAQQFGKVNKSLGLLETGFNEAAKSASKLWDWLKSIGRDETAADQIEELARKARAARSALEFFGQRGVSGTALASLQAAADKTNEQLDAQRELARNEEKAAQGQAAAAASTARQLAASEAVRALRAETDAQARANAEVEKYRRNVAELAGTAEQVSAAQQRIDEARIRKRYAGGADTEGDQAAQAALQARLRTIDAALRAEQARYAHQQREVEAIFADANISAQEFYARRAEITQAGVDAEIRAAEGRAKALQRALGDTREATAREGIAGQLRDEQERIGEIRAAAQRNAQLAAGEAAREIRGLMQRVGEFRGSLAELGGDEFGAATQRIRAQVEEARRLLAQAGVAPAQAEADVALYERRLQQQRDFAQLQREVEIATERARIAEEAYLIDATARGAGQAEIERGIYGVRQEALAQVGALSDRMQALAAASADPKLQLWAEQLAASVKRAADEVDPYLKRLRDHADDFGRTLASSFESAVQSAEDLGDVFDQLAKDIGRLVWRETITNPLAESISRAIRGGITPATASGGAGYDWGGAFAAFAGLFGGGGGAINWGSVGAENAEIVRLFNTARRGGIAGETMDKRWAPAALLDGAQRYRRGGIVLGPDEVPAILHRREEVLTAADPRHRDNGGRGGRGALVVNVAPPEGTSNATAAQWGASIGQAIARSMGRGNV